MNTTLLNASALVQLNISVWTGRAKLQRTDLNVNEDDLPPEAVASLGSKRLFPIEDLRIFNALKTKAFKYLGQVGVQFMKGWLVEESQLGAIDQHLDQMRHEFDKARDAFVDSYYQKSEEWLTQYPEWRDMLAKAMPSVSDVASRFSFGWQGFKIAPTAENSISSQAMTKELQSVPERARLGALNELVELYNGPFVPGKAISKKTLRPLKTYIDKLNALSFANPELDRYSRMLCDVYDDMFTTQNPDQPWLRDKLRDVVQRIVGEKLASNLLIGAGTQSSYVPESQEESILIVEPINKVMESASSQPQPQVTPEFDSFGLW